jgi:pimeloyl-ACP methyl ester carboxylesterase
MPHIPQHAPKTFTTSRSHIYSYIHIPPLPPTTTKPRPHILFLHGFPGSLHDWRHQFQFFHQQGYGIIAPDLLGYGGSSKPRDVREYSGRGMAGDLRELLEHEGVEGVVGVAHDW